MCAGRPCLQNERRHFVWRAKILGFVRWIDTINDWIGKIFCSTLIFIMVFAVYEVVRRYFFSNPTTWVWEINSQLLCFMGALGGGYALLHNSHVSVDIVVARLSPRAKAIIDIITSPLFFLFSGCLIWYGSKEAFRAYAVDQHVISTFASPLWPIKSIIALGGILIFLQGLAKLIRDINTVREKEE
jgi:TRAP-type mannitol/chloroaromatic compound transport system permease small subunit